MEDTAENGQQAKRIQRSSLIIIRENSIPQGLSVCTDGSICRQPVTVQPGRRFDVRLRPVKTVQPTQSQPPASQCWWKQSPMPSPGLPQAVTTTREDSAAYTVSTSSFTMLVEAVTHALRWVASSGDSWITHAIVLTDSVSLLRN